MSNSPSIEADLNKNDNDNPIIKAINDTKNIQSESFDENSDDANNIFSDGILEEFQEKEILPSNWNHQGSVVYKSNIERKRKQPFKMVLVRAKREFGAPVIFYDKDPGVEGNYEVKPPPKTHDYNTSLRGILEIGFQTGFSNMKPIERTYQVSTVQKVNVYSQVEEKNTDLKPIFDSISNEYTRSDKKDLQTQKTNIQKIEDFIKQVRPKIEEALQSNETIDIFQSDFHLDKFESIEEKKDEKKTNDSEVKTYRDNYYAGQKSKKEKSINCIRLVNSEKEYLAHSLIRNLSFEERIKIIGIPYTSQIIFWNFQDTEVNSPVYVLELPMEITNFEFNPLNPNNLICCLYSGQLIIYEFKDIMNILHNGFDSEFTEKLMKKQKSEVYTFYITPISESHKSYITGFKWFPPGYSFHKYQMQYNQSIKDINIFATISDDGQILVWDCKNFDRTIKNEVGNYIKPVLKIEVNRFDFNLKAFCRSIELKIKGNDSMMYVGTNEGEIYGIDWKERVTSENLTNNIKQNFGTSYYRPVHSIEVSPFYDDIILSVYDFYFCIWSSKYTKKPIIVTPNLKSSFYVSGKFSKSRPGVVYLSRNNGQIDIWDFLDESHKPSVKETFLKENLIFMDLINYKPVTEDENGNIKSQNIEYLVIGDQSGQMSVMIVSKLFTEKVNNELELVRNIFNNEVNRQIYMENRYKSIEEEYNKPIDRIDLLISQSKKNETKEKEGNEETELKYMEEAYIIEKNRILEEYGFELREEREDDD